MRVIRTDRPIGMIVYKFFRGISHFTNSYSRLTLGEKEKKRNNSGRKKNQKGKYSNTLKRIVACPLISNTIGLWDSSSLKERERGGKREREKEIKTNFFTHVTSCNSPHMTEIRHTMRGKCSHSNYI